jgi:tryptophan-rich sensory protein
MKQKWTNLLLWVVGTELVGALSAMLSGGNFSAYYRSLNQPPFAPPGWLFPVMWAILYALMGISAFLIQESDSLRKKQALVLYGAQLFANFLWSPVFFGLKSHLGATVVVIVMLLLIIAMMTAFLRIRPLAGYLNIPYLFWAVFATYLTIGVLVLN